MNKDKLNKLKTFLLASTAHEVVGINPQKILELIADYEQLQEDYERVFRDAADESAKVVMLEKEADWLASMLPEQWKCEGKSRKPVPVRSAKEWREAAREAVK